MQVLEHHQQRAVAGQAAEQLGHHLHAAAVHRLTAELAQHLVGLGVGRQAGQCRQERVGLGVVAEHAVQGRLQVETDARLGGGGAGAEPVAQQLAHRPVGEALGVGQRAALEHGQAVAQRLDGVGHQARLADARLAGDRDDHADALGQPLEPIADIGQLAVATDQRLGREAARVLELADHAEAVDRSLAATQRGLAQLLQLEAAPHLGGGLRAERDRGLVGQRLQPRGDVDGVAERVVATAVIAGTGGDDHRAGVHGDARAQLDAVGLGHALGVLGQSTLDGEAGAHGSLAVVLVRNRGAEHGQQPIAEQLRDGAVIALDLGRHQAHDLVEQELRPLRAQPLADRG